MVCEDCGTVYYSAAARIMVERGERCAKCGGKLVLASAPRPLRARRGSQPAGGGPGDEAA
jgi:DNA-directed RNA polymerase subunit RPC12/RpoP